LAPATKSVKKPSLHFWHCSATLVTWRTAETLPFAAACRRETRYCDSASGRRARRVAMVDQSSAVAVGIRSNVERRLCGGLASTLRSESTRPASYSSTSTPRRSVKTALATRSASSAGSTADTSASARRARSAAAALPSGDRSGHWSSYPGMPSSVAMVGARRT
jgi:hypothetical protein